MYHIFSPYEISDKEGIFYKRVKLITQICDFWVEMEDSCSEKAEFRMLEFMLLWTQELDVIRFVLNSFRN